LAKKIKTMSNHSELPSVKDNRAVKAGWGSAFVVALVSGLFMVPGFDEISASVKEVGLDVSDVTLSVALTSVWLALSFLTQHAVSEGISRGSNKRVSNAPRSEADQG
jgi:hypothetical protein